MKYNNSASFGAGSPCKVLFIADNGVAHGRFANGNICRWDTSGGPALKPGNIVIIQNDLWELAPDGCWPSHVSISVVNIVLPNGLVLIDFGATVRAVANPHGFALRRDQTVEWDEDGVVRVLSNEPIRGYNPADVYNAELERPGIEPAALGYDFEDFGGYATIVDRIKTVIDLQFNRRQNLAEIGARPIRGLLLAGPPGTGKTHLGRIFASHAKADFFLIDGPDIVSKWIGESERILRSIFHAASQSPSGRAIVFLDEIDSIAERRTGAHESSRRLVAQLLTLMDGFNNKGGHVFFVAATNRLDVLDPAVTRPGRFDWIVEFDMPTYDDRLAILRASSRRLSTHADLPIDEIAMLTEGWSAAELTAIWPEAALITASDNRNRITGDDTLQAFQRVVTRVRPAMA